jgi:hypothetical protein
MKKEHLYTTAKVKGLHNCTVAILNYDEANQRYFCITPFQTKRYYSANELESFVI